MAAKFSELRERAEVSFLLDITMSSMSATSFSISGRQVGVVMII